jgi:hypothetical protein
VLTIFYPSGTNSSRVRRHRPHFKGCQSTLLTPHFFTNHNIQFMRINAILAAMLLLAANVAFGQSKSERFQAWQTWSTAVSEPTWAYRLTALVSPAGDSLPVFWNGPLDREAYYPTVGFHGEVFAGGKQRDVTVYFQKDSATEFYISGIGVWEVSDTLPTLAQRGGWQAVWSDTTPAEAPKLLPRELDWRKSNFNLSLWSGGFGSEFASLRLRFHFGGAFHGAGMGAIFSVPVKTWNKGKAWEFALAPGGYLGTSNPDDPDLSNIGGGLEFSSRYRSKDWKDELIVSAMLGGGEGGAFWETEARYIRWFRKANPAKPHWGLMVEAHAFGGKPWAGIGVVRNVIPPTKPVAPR